MNREALRADLAVGKVEPAHIDFLKYSYLEDILEAKGRRKATALVAYAGFLNSWGIHPDNYPLFLHVIATNHGHAIETILRGYQPETFLDVVVPNHFIVKSFFEFLREQKKNEVYAPSLRVILGFLEKVYKSPAEGFQLYKATIADVNAVGKLLDESKDQDDPLNRDILDLLLYFSKLDMPHETDQHKLDIARQSSRIRSDFFDNTRSLIQSLTDVLLETNPNATFGLAPEYRYGKA